MNLKNLDYRKLSLDTSLFRKIYLILISFEMIAFLDIPSIILKSVVLVWGIFILVHNFFISKIVFKIKYHYLLWSFLILMLITSVVHMSIWFIPNLVITYYTAICFFVFYGMCARDNFEVIEKEMNFILKFYVNFSLVFGLISLCMLVIKPDTALFGYYLGIYKNRLIGIYTNSNILAFSMIEAIVSSDILADFYFINSFKFKKISNWKLFICPIVSLVCLFLSDSNASFVFLIIYLTIRVFCNLLFKSNYSRRFKFFRSMLITFGFCLSIISIFFSLRECCQNFMNVVINDVHNYAKYTVENTENSNVKIFSKKEYQNIFQKNENETPKNEETQNTKFHIGRDHYEVSSGRITLFKQGIKIFKKNPIIGIGRANLRLYARKYIKGGLIHPDLHNGYLTILVSNGILGFLVFMIFSALVAIDICKCLFKFIKHDDFDVFCKLFSILVAYCGYCLFEKAIVFDMTFMVGFFWSMLGYTVSRMYRYKNLKNTI